MDDFKDSATALVADVDCTAGGSSLCEKNGVSGYPTIKWGDPSDLKDYDGERAYDQLKKFADDNLGPTCGPDNLDLCDAADKKLIAKYLKWDIDELDLSIEEADEKISSMEKAAKKKVDALEGKVKGLQDKIEKENKKKEKAIAKERETSGYKFMKMVDAPRATEDENFDNDDEGESAESKPDAEKKEEL